MRTVHAGKPLSTLDDPAWRALPSPTKTNLTPTTADSNGSKNREHPGWYAGVKKVPANGGPTVDVGGQRLTWKVRGEDTAYIFSIYEMTLLPESALALHYHPYAEIFYVLDGEVEFGSMKDRQEEWIPCRAGETVVAGPDAVHGFRNSSGKPARFLSISTQQHQAFFDECAVSARNDDPPPVFPEGEELARLLQGANKHQIYLFEKE
jgi:quercetin dioxygenase-like cupin family protein